MKWFAKKQKLILFLFKFYHMIFKSLWNGDLMGRYMSIFQPVN